MCLVLGSDEHTEQSTTNELNFDLALLLIFYELMFTIFSCNGLWCFLME